MGNYFYTGTHPAFLKQAELDVLTYAEVEDGPDLKISNIDINSKLEKV